MAWCLVQSEVEAFKKALSTKKINPFKLVDMTSEQRRALFEKYITKDNAQRVNSLYESKLLLKNLDRGFTSWAKRSLGMSPQVKRDVMSKIARLNELETLNPKDLQSFKEDLVRTRLGLGITMEEATTIKKMSEKVEKLKKKIQKDSTFKNENEAMKYGRAKASLIEYVGELKAREQPTIKELIKTPKIVSEIAGNQRSIKASMDNSAIFRQGWKTMFTHPKIWGKNAVQSFQNIVKTFGKDEVMHETNAYLLSRRNNINGYDKRAKLALSVTEEEYPGSFYEKALEKIPGVNKTIYKAYKASENAFTAFVHTTRAQVFDTYIDIAEKNGVDLTNEQLQAIGKVVNSLTGRGNVGKLEPAADVFNNLFWSPRKLKSDIDILTVHAFDKGITKFARKQAAINTAKVIIGNTIILGMASMLGRTLLGEDDVVDFNPLSANFGKIKIKNTRFDVTGGIAPLITLVSRLITGKSKSSVTGKVSDLTSDEYGARSLQDVIFDFGESKLSPFAGTLLHTVMRKDFFGEKFTPVDALSEVFIPTPLSIENAIEDYKDYSPDERADMLAIIIAEQLGFSINTYKYKEDWGSKTTKEMENFKQQVGENQFKKAETDYNRDFGVWYEQLQKDQKFKSLSDEEKSDVVSAGKKAIKEKILDEYGYKKPKKTFEQKKQEKKDKEIKKGFIEGLKSLNLTNPFKVKEAFAADRSPEERLQSERRRWYKIALKYREENPEWYAKNIGEEGEKKLFGHTIGQWPIQGEDEYNYKKGYNKYTPNWVKPIVDKAADKYKVPTIILTSQQFKESSFRKNAVSKAGAVGISQFMPATARKYGLKVNDKVDERLDPDKAIPAQARLMADLKKQYGSWERALSAYNSGNPDAYKDPDFAEGETYNYVRDIMLMLKF